MTKGSCRSTKAIRGLKGLVNALMAGRVGEDVEEDAGDRAGKERLSMLVTGKPLICLVGQKTRADKCTAVGSRCAAL